MLVDGVAESAQRLKISALVQLEAPATGGASYTAATGPGRPAPQRHVFVPPLPTAGGFSFSRFAGLSLSRPQVGLVSGLLLAVGVLNPVNVAQAAVPIALAGQAVGWGQGGQGQLGTAIPADSPEPVAVGALARQDVGPGERGRQPILCSGHRG
jgi:hypothetical protein